MATHDFTYLRFHHRWCERASKSENIYHNQYGIRTIDKPIIEDALALMMIDLRASEYSDRKLFDKVLDETRYFSASYSHCRYRDSDENDEGSVMLFETGHELVAL